MTPEDLQQTEQQELSQPFLDDEWQYCYLEQSLLQAALAGSGT